jgi:hypothetical protein
VGWEQGVHYAMSNPHSFPSRKIFSVPALYEMHQIMAVENDFSRAIIRAFARTSFYKKTCPASVACDRAIEKQNSTENLFREKSCHLAPFKKNWTGPH